MSAAGPAEEFARAAIRAGLEQQGVAAADVYVKEGRHARILRRRDATSITEAGESGFAVRMFRSGGRVGHAFSAETGDPGALAAAVAAASSLAGRCSESAAEMPPGAWDAPDLDLYDPAVESASAVGAMLDRLSEAVLEEGAGEVAVESILCVAGSSRIVLATSGRFLGAYRTSLVTIILALRAARGGDSFFDRSVVAARHLASIDADRLGREAARRARLPLDGASLEPGPLPVVLDPRIACLLVDHLAASLEAGAAESGRSALPANDPGCRVGGEQLSIIDDASLRRGLGSCPFDGEGRPTSAWRLVDAGRLGALLGEPRGRGRVGAAHRASYADPPRRTASNLHLERGELGPRALRRQAGDALRVTGATLLGRGGAASGEVVLAVSGERLQDGEAVSGVREATLIGRLPELLEGVRAVGNDLSFHLRGAVVGSPSVLLDGFSVA